MSENTIEIFRELSEYLNYFINNLEIDDSVKVELVENIIKITDGKYKYNDKEVKINYTIKNFLENTAKLNEINKNRKLMGIYYTPEDLANYMAFNALLDNFKKDRTKLYNYDSVDITELQNDIDLDCIFKKKIIDPTCGNSEFLISIIKSKIKILNYNYETDDIVQISKNLYGNDLNSNSVYISKVRVFIYLVSLLVEIELEKTSMRRLSKNINENFTNQNILTDFESKTLFDVVIGNPPYVESNRYPLKLKENYGNIYANILEESLNMLAKGGVLSFIIPISYISTPRMKKIRKLVKLKAGKELIINFADRPDSLFSSAHQKLSLVFIEKKHEQTDRTETYTSNYQYWYKEERKNLFENINVVYNELSQEGFIPKLGSLLDISIYKKITPIKEGSIYDYISNKNHFEDSIYLNMRATFWIKGFLGKGISKEYKKIHSLTKHKFYLYCIFNSSLFFWYWTVVSDCWHITNKEFKNFKLILDLDKKTLNKMEELALELSLKLEETKVYVGTKQIDYEYKHKECKPVIDKIDQELSKIYKFTAEELIYIQSFSAKYRESRGV